MARDRASILVNTVMRAFLRQIAARGHAESVGRRAGAIYALRQPPPTEPDYRLAASKVTNSCAEKTRPAAVKELKVQVLVALGFTALFVFLYLTRDLRIPWLDDLSHEEKKRRSIIQMMGIALSVIVLAWGWWRYRK